MKRTELQHKTGLNETELDTLLNKLSQLPRWEGMIDTLSDSVDNDIAQYIITEHSKSSSSKALKAVSDRDRNGLFDPPKESIEKPASMSIESFKGDEMAVTAEQGIDNQRASTDQYQSNSQGMQSGIIHEQIEQKQFEGQVAGEVGAAAFVSAYNESFQETLTRYGDSQFNAHVEFMEDLFGMAQSATAQSSEQRVKALSDRSEEYQKMKARVQGKFKD